MRFETLINTPKAMHLKGVHHAGGVKPLDLAQSKVISKGVQCGFGLQTAAMATIFSGRGSSIAVATRIDQVWNMAREAAKVLPKTAAIPSMSPGAKFPEDRDQPRL